MTATYSSKMSEPYLSRTYLISPYRIQTINAAEETTQRVSVSTTLRRHDAPFIKSKLKSLALSPRRHGKARISYFACHCQSFGASALIVVVYESCQC